MMRRLPQVLKKIARGFSLLFAYPFAAVTAFGRFSAGFQICGQLLALLPGLPGDFLRVAFYSMTLRKCSLNSRISFGSFFAQSNAYVDTEVYIGAYCVIGACEIGKRTQIASLVQVLSGKRQHERSGDGQLLAAREEQFQPIVIGSDCWIGAAAIVMADIGDRTTIGAATVVTRPLPPDVVAVGNPARILESVAK